MISGVTVQVVRREETGRDAFNMPTHVETAEDVAGVVVAPASTVDIDGVGRPEGDEVALTLHFPKTYTESLRGASVVVDGRRFEVVGDPQPYLDANTPGQWNRPVAARRIEG